MHLEQDLYFGNENKLMELYCKASVSDWWKNL